MERLGVKVAAVTVLVAFVISWFFDLEVLFLLGALISTALASLIVLLVGVVTLADRAQTLTAAEKKWNEVRPAPSRQTIAG